MRVVKTSFGELVEGGIYEHWKNGDLYMIDCVGKLHDSQNVFLVNYHRCTKDGLYVTLRENLGEPNEKIIHQPFTTHETRWHDEVINQQGEKVKRFKLI